MDETLAGFMAAGIGVFGAVLGSVVGAFVSYRFLAIREFASACGELHAAFAHVKIVLEGNAATKPPKLVIESISAQERAIARFRFQLSKYRRPAFDQACKEYRQRRIAIEAEETFDAIAAQGRAQLLESINQILSYADDGKAPNAF